ncbi:MAG: hypothetical protein LBB94_12975 [Clostridiales bacterium]|jgi:YbbR domain-containing protein|nr:hypothetical protein [Clostridiales bacterium]
MIKVFSAFVFKDIWWKLFALFSAVLLYYIVFIIADPPQNMTIRKNITFAGEDVLVENGFFIENKDKIPSTVLLNIRSRTSDVSNLYNPSTISAVIDFSSIDESYNNWVGQRIPLSIDVNLPSVYSVQGKTPEGVSIVINKMLSEFRPVEVIPEGTVKEGYENLPPVFRDTVEVTAPQTVLAKIKSIRVEVSVKNADNDIVIEEAPLRVLDTEDNDITDSVELSVEKIQVRIPVYPIKELPVKARWSSPESGYWVSDVTVSPQTIEVVGPADILQNIEAIELAPIQLSGVTSDLSVDFNIWDYLEDSKLSLRGGGVFNVNVAVHIQEESSKQLSLQIRNISIIRDDNRLVPQLPADQIPVIIRGSADAISNVTDANLRAELDLSGLSAGIHDVELHFELPNVSISNAPIKLRVVISEKLSTATVLPSDSIVPEVSVALNSETSGAALENRADDGEPPAESSTGFSDISDTPGSEGTDGLINAAPEGAPETDILSPDDGKNETA